MKIKPIANKHAPNSFFLTVNACVRVDCDHNCSANSAKLPSVDVSHTALN